MLCGSFVSARTATCSTPPPSRKTDGPMTPKAFHALFGRIGERAKMPFPVHPHMLRHGCGYALANAGAAGVARPQEHPAHGALHRAGAGQV
jgi:integrase